MSETSSRHWVNQFGLCCLRDQNVAMTVRRISMIHTLTTNSTFQYHVLPRSKRVASLEIPKRSPLICLRLNARHLQRYQNRLKGVHLVGWSMLTRDNLGNVVVKKIHQNLRTLHQQRCHTLVAVYSNMQITTRS